MSISKKFLEFMDLLNKEIVSDLEFEYVNIFRYKVDGDWCYGGYDAFADLKECRLWAEEFLKFPENNKNEILPTVKTSDIKKYWAENKG